MDMRANASTHTQTQTHMRAEADGSLHESSVNVGRVIKKKKKKSVFW